MLNKHHLNHNNTLYSQKSLKFTMMLANQAVNIQFDNTSWLQIFKKHWGSYITRSQACGTIYISTNSPTLETLLDHMDMNNLYISCHPDRLSKHMFKTLNYGIKRIIGRWLFDRNVYLIHASAVINNHNNILLFTGPQGSGKSTIIRLLTSFTPIADDVVFVTFKKNSLVCYTTPFSEKHTYNTRVNDKPIQAIFYLQKHTHSIIENLPPYLKIKKTLQLFFLYHINGEILLPRILNKAQKLMRYMRWHILKFPAHPNVNHYYLTSKFN